MKKSIKLVPAFLVYNNEIAEGMGFEFDKSETGGYLRRAEKFFITKDDVLINESWCNKIFFDKKEAVIFFKNEKNKNINFYKDQIKEYTDKLKKLETGN